MGLNSIHDSSKNFIWCENKTNNTRFKCSIKTRGFQKMQVVQNIDVNVITCVLIVNGFCDIKNNDIIRVPFYNRELRVVNWDSTIDEQLARRRADFENFTGETTIALS